MNGSGKKALLDLRKKWVFASVILAAIMLAGPSRAANGATTPVSAGGLPSGDSSEFRPKIVSGIAGQLPGRRIFRGGANENVRSNALRHALTEKHHVGATTRSLVISSPFGWRRDSFSNMRRPHDGIDLPGRLGAPVRATGRGVVSFAGWMNGYGNLVQIDHMGGLRTRYGHLSRILVRDGERVDAGDVIGAIGSTGRSTGNHLHYEIRHLGLPIDPMAYLGGAIRFRSVDQDARSDLIELGTAADERIIKVRWSGWTPSTEGLPQATIR